MNKKTLHGNGMGRSSRMGMGLVWDRNSILLSWEWDGTGVKIISRVRDLKNSKDMTHFFNVI